MTSPGTSDMPDRSRSKDRSVRETLLIGVFWRILTIEVILLIGTLAYEAGFKDADPSHLFWYALRILGLVGIIILFMMVTLERFLTKKIIVPLENIAAANERFQKHQNRANDVDLPDETPKEIRGIASTRRQMLDTILKVSEERLRLADFIRDTFGRYLSRKVVNEIIENPTGRRIGGRRKAVVTRGQRLQRPKLFRFRAVVNGALDHLEQGGPRQIRNGRPPIEVVGQINGKRYGASVIVEIDWRFHPQMGRNQIAHNGAIQVVPTD